MKTKKEDVPPIPEPLAHNYHADNWQEVIKNFDGHYPSGLKDSEVNAKLTAYGFNEMLLKSTPKWLIFLKQFNNVIIYILIVAALLTLLMRHYSDATVIGLVVIINALIGYFQEINASNA
uniref:cation-transporting P-type ATPase n=1 Tax=uncultured Leuconostoc sp. TaxID=173262 RepID=UPI0025CCFA63